MLPLLLLSLLSLLPLPLLSPLSLLSLPLAGTFVDLAQLFQKWQTKMGSTATRIGIGAGTGTRADDAARDEPVPGCSGPPWGGDEAGASVTKRVSLKIRSIQESSDSHF
jgi:hypothetical protein